jgi:hypothetical protein
MKLINSTISPTERVEATVSDVKDKVALMRAKFLTARQEIETSNAVDVTLADIEQDIDSVALAIDEALIDIRLISQERRGLVAKSQEMAGKIVMTLNSMPPAAAYATAQRDYSRSALQIYDPIVAAYIKVALYELFDKKNLPIDEWK